MAQTAYARWPTLAELRSLFPGGAPAPELGLPASVHLVRFDLRQDFPLLRSDLEVPPGTTYLTTVGDVLGEAGVPVPDGDEWVSRALRLVGRVGRRLLVALNLPLAWTAPPLDPSPTYVPRRTRMTSPAPARLPVPGGVRVVHKGTVSGQAVYMTHGMVATGPTTPAHLQAIANGCRDAFGTHIRPELVNQFVYGGCSALALDEGAAATAEAAGTGTGGSASAMASLNVAAVISLRTARAGRSYRGRIFHAPFPQPGMTADGRTLTAAYIDILRGRYEAYRSAVNGITGSNGAALAVVSHRLGTAEPVTAIVVRQVIGSQRGRLS